MGFPHSEISGSKVAGHLPEAYRRQTTSFIAFFSLGIHHTPLLRTIPTSEEASYLAHRTRRFDTLDTFRNSENRVR